jgi:DNA end-binding protein Ku
MLKMAEQIIASKEIAFSPATFEDRYEDALLALVKSKINGGEPVIAKAPERGNVVNLMDALRRSIEEERRPPAPSLAKAAAKPAAKKPAAAKAAAAAPAAPAPARKKKTA